MPPIPVPQIRSQVSRGLGDTDLVETILSPTRNLGDVALNLITEQTGWNDISLDDRPADQSTTTDSTSAIPTPRSIAEVAFGGQSFGALGSGQASSAQLRPWADWLARWLALDRAHRQFRLQAMQDDLTGAWNRRFFELFLAEAIDRAAKARRPLTVMVFDLDNFKSFNDEFGHAAGDEILCETVRLVKSVIRQGDRVCRIGGDEFAVIFADPEAPRSPGSTHPESVDLIAKRFQDQICRMRFPKLGDQAPGSISISAGLATFPWDGNDARTLLNRADQLALESKRKGKNAITLGRGAQRMCGPEHD
jgi:two-component system cell cycle response regulator